MNKIVFISCLILFAVGACTPNVEQQLADSREATQLLATSLKGELKNSLQTEGPIAAISVCNHKAPEITKTISKQTNVQIGRTSLKLRNPQNAADAWEKVQLELFQKQLAGGADLNNLELYEITEGDTGKQFRYMKAIPAGEPCLLCHGESIAPPIQASLERLYPNDEAIGYRVGDLRGAFTIKIDL